MHCKLYCCISNWTFFDFYLNVFELVICCFTILFLSFKHSLNCLVVNKLVLFVFTSLSLQVSRILYSFATAFRRSAKKAILSSQQAAPLTPDSDLFTFTVSLEIREDDGKGTFRWDEYLNINIFFAQHGNIINDASTAALEKHRRLKT